MALEGYNSVAEPRPFMRGPAPAGEPHLSGYLLIARGAGQSHMRGIMSVSDRELIEACKEGRDAPFEELVNRYKMKAYSLAYFLVGNSADALDISQEAFIKIYRNFHRFREKCSFGTWLHRITYNLCMDFLRKRKGRIMLSYQDEVGDGRKFMEMRSGESSNPRRGLMKQEAGKAVWEAINRLPVKLMSVLVLREIEGLSYGEIAEVVDCSKGTVMSRLHHARKKLRRTLEPAMNKL